MCPCCHWNMSLASNPTREYNVRKAFSVQNLLNSRNDTASLFTSNHLRPERTRCFCTVSICCANRCTNCDTKREKNDFVFQKLRESPHSFLQLLKCSDTLSSIVLIQTDMWAIKSYCVWRASILEPCDAGAEWVLLFPRSDSKVRFRLKNMCFVCSVSE